MSNSSLAVRILPETERYLAYGSVASSFTAIGGPLAHAAIMIIFQNLTDKAVTFSWDGINAHLTLNASTSFILDIQSNRGRSNCMAAAQGTQFWVEYISSPSLGGVYIDVFYGANFNNK